MKKKEKISNANLCQISKEKTHERKSRNNYWEVFTQKQKYMIEIYIINATNDNVMALLYIPIERNVNTGTDENMLAITWKTKDVECNQFSLIYDDIMDCYEDVNDSTANVVSAILKNGMKFQVECVGIRV